MSGRFRVMRAAAAAATTVALHAPASAHPDDVHLVPSALGTVGWQAVPTPRPAAEAGRSLGALEGPVYGHGFGLELRLFERVGLELELWRTRHTASAQAAVVGASGELSLERDALTLALLPRLTPGELALGLEAFVVPVIELGAALDLPSDALSGLPVGPARERAAWLATLGLGAEVGLVLPMVDLRFPVLLRAGLDPTAPDTLAARWAGSAASAALDARPAWRVALVLGVSGHLTLGSGPPLADPPPHGH